MAHLINKDAIVAEIKKRLDELWDLLPNASDVIKDNYTKEEANITGKYTALESFENFINTLEVKEVDLEKAYKSYMKSREDDLSGNAVTVNLKYLARHFFELGLSVNNKTQKGE